MSGIIKQAGSFLISRIPLTQSQRYRGKINIQRPRKPHYERAKFILATQPIYPEPDKTVDCFQPPLYKLQKLEQKNPYDDIIAKEVRNWLDHSRMVAFFHMNSIKADELFKIRVQLHRQNIHLKDYGKKIIEKAVNGSKYEVIIPLFDSSHCIVFSTEQKVNQLVRITRKVPQLILLAGIVEDRLLSRKEFIQFGQMPGLDAVRAEFVQTLNMAGSSIVQNLEAHQNNLVNILDVYSKNEASSEPDSEKDKSKIEEPAKES